MWFRALAWLSLLFLTVLACAEDDPIHTVVPEPQTAEDLIVADCYEIQAALEAFASAHGGLFPTPYMGGGADPELYNGLYTLRDSLLRPNRYTGLVTEPRLLGEDRRWPGQIGVTLFQEIPKDVYSGDWTRAGLVYGYRITGYGANGVIITLENTASVSTEALATFETLWQNVVIIAAAAERFFTDAGRYPMHVYEFSGLLPGGELLVNPLSTFRDSPADGAATGTPGLIGYSTNAAYFPCTPGVDYQVDVAGPGGNEIVFKLQPFSAEDMQTRYWMYFARFAVEAFRNASGRYPIDLDQDETPAGHTALDLLSGPGCPAGWTHTNAYTGEPALPVTGLATTPGDIGYLPVEDNGEVVGYVINGFGIVDEFERIEKVP
jgi:hypothetical protein